MKEAKKKTFSIIHDSANCIKRQCKSLKKYKLKARNSQRGDVAIGKFEEFFYPVYRKNEIYANGDFSFYLFYGKIECCAFIIAHCFYML
jgi:hypothetical protein